MDFERYFLSNSTVSIDSYRDAIAIAQDILTEAYGNQPYSGATPEALAQVTATLTPCPISGQQLQKVLNNVGRLVAQHSMNVSHPHCIAHLHCPPLIPALQQRC